VGGDHVDIARFWEVDLALGTWDLDPPKSISRLDHLPHTQLWPIASKKSRWDGRSRSEEHNAQDRCSEVETEQTGAEHTGGELRWSGIGTKGVIPPLHGQGGTSWRVSTHSEDVGVKCRP
jgi:hypothetical protein